MKKLIFLSILVLGLTGCGKQDTTTTETILDYAQDKISDADASVWTQNCQTIITSLTGIEGISSVTISPSDFNAYVSVGKATVQITLDDPISFSAQSREDVKTIIQNLGLQDKFEIMYMN